LPFLDLGAGTIILTRGYRSEMTMDDEDEIPTFIQEPPVRTERALEIAREGTRRIERAIATEVPVSITFNGFAHAVMMATPDDLEDFVTGFTLSEAIVSNAGEIDEIDIRPVDGGMLAALRVPKERFNAVMAGRRNIVGQTGCGVCGIMEIENLVRPARPLPKPERIVPALIFDALAALRAHQPLNKETGAVHAAAFVDWAGTIKAVREDVGRHNALDKLIGHLARTKTPASSGFALLSSRCSFELVQKTALAGIPMLVTVSAPTTFAIDLARKSGLTLIALARADTMLCLSDPHGLFAGHGA
jgi:FdhD protein